MNANVYSVYIPNMHIRWTRTAIAEFFHRANYGIVQRIDYSELIMFDGSKNPTFRSAFIFFIPIYDASGFNALANPGFASLPKGYKIHPTLRFRDQYGFEHFVNHKGPQGNFEYWIALPNKNVVPDNTETLEQLREKLNICDSLLCFMPENDETLEQETDILAYNMKCLEELSTYDASYFDTCLVNHHQLANNIRLQTERLSVFVPEPKTEQV